MTAEEKAKELVDKFTFNCRECDNAKQYALIAVDEILDIIRYHGTDIGKHSLLYWLNVREEINIL
jgi:hypothetical protein